MNLAKITDSKARRFAKNFFLHREVNREFYSRVPIDDFDAKMSPISDTPRQSLAHQIEVQRGYLLAIEKGKLIWGAGKDEDLKHNPKDFLLREFKKGDEKLCDMLADSDVLKKKIEVPWSEKPIPVVKMLWAMYEHEIFHTGWNVAMMDHLNMERFPKLRNVWG